MQYVETPIEDDIKVVERVICPDKGACPDGNTCCKDYIDGGYGCCPLPDAVCCTFNEYCCPHAQTCCESGCCPYPNGVCCKDMSCCPNGTQCELQPDRSSRCLGSNLLPILMGLPEFNSIDPLIEKVE